MTHSHTHSTAGETSSLDRTEGGCEVRPSGDLIIGGEGGGGGGGRPCQLFLDTNDCRIAQQNYHIERKYILMHWAERRERKGGEYSKCARAQRDGMRETQ